METKKLLQSQRELLYLKQVLIKQRQIEFQETVNIISDELGITFQERSKWKLNEDMTALEKE